jgi:hypothetical protein
MLGCHVKPSADQISLSASCPVVLGRICISSEGFIVPSFRFWSRDQLQDPLFAAYIDQTISEARSGGRQVAGIMENTPLAIIDIAHHGMELAMDKSAWKVTRTRHGVP